MLLVENSKSNYKILLSQSASLAEKYAAEQLQKYICLVTGAKLEISTKNVEPVISVGKTELFESLNITVDEKTFNYDGFIIKTIGESIVIQGANNRGTVYGVNEFIESILGVKFLAPNVNYIPKQDTIEIESLDMREIPEFRHRLYYDGGVFFDNFDPEYAVHRRMFNDFLKEKPEYGYEQEWLKSIPSVHNIFSYVPIEKYKETHPEFFASYTDPLPLEDDVCYLNGLNDDGTVDDSKDLSVFKIALQSLKEYILAEPKAKFFCVSLNDGARLCKCERCQKAIEKYGSFGAVYILFMNALSKEIELWQKEIGMDREIYLQFYIYSHTKLAPKDKDDAGNVFHELKLRDNVIGMYCVWINSAYAINDKRQKIQYMENLENWSKFGKNLMIWDYYAYFDLYSLYYPQLTTMKQNYRFYKKITNYVLSQSDYTKLNSWTSLVSSYVASKLFWNLELDTYELAEEFIEYYHGRFAPYVKEFFYNFEHLYEQLMEKDGFFVWPNRDCSSWCNRENFTKEFLENNINILKTALKSVESSTLCENDKNDHKERITQALIIPQTMLLHLYCDDLYSTEYDEAFEELFENLKICKQDEDIKGDFLSEIYEGVSAAYLIHEDRACIRFEESITYQKQCVERVLVRKEEPDVVAKLVGANLDDLYTWIEKYGEEVLKYGVKSTTIYS